MIAYACDPAGGGEHWLGWGWALEASRRHDLVLFTTSRGKPALQNAASESGIEVHYLDVPSWIRCLSGFPPGLGAWLRKIWWQRMALREARELHATKRFDLVHQTTFHTFRIPFLCAGLGIPSVWGPVAGGEAVPAGFDKCLGKAASGERRRALLNRFCLRLPWVRSSLRKSSVILVSNRTTLDFLPEDSHAKCLVMSPNALREEDIVESSPQRPSSRHLTLLFAGNCVATRAMPLVFEALALGMPSEWQLKIVGSGTALDFWREEVTRLGLTGSVEFTGAVPRTRLQELYRESSALVFPALRDSGGSALLEAMTLSLPILALDWGGPGEMVNPECAIMVRPVSPEQTIREIHSGLIRLTTHAEEMTKLGDAARRRALQLFRWEGKAKVVDAIYRKLAN